MLKIVEPAHAAQLLPSITAAFSAALPAPGQGTRFALHEPSAAELARGVRESAPPAGGAPPSPEAADQSSGGATDVEVPPAPSVLQGQLAAKRGGGRKVAMMFDRGGAQTFAQKARAAPRTTRGKRGEGSEAATPTFFC